MWSIYTFFDEDQRIENFRHADRILPARRISRSGPVYQFERETRELNATYEFKGEIRNVGEFLDRTVTINAAWQLFMDDKVGSLEVGKLADLAILSANPLETEPVGLDQIQVIETYRSGRKFSHAASGR